MMDKPPRTLVKILHSVPHINITFQYVNDTFNLDNKIYIESLGILASIPAALLILSLLGLLLYLLTRCCDRKQRKTSSQRCQNCTLVTITLLCCAAIGLGLYGNDDFHNGLLQTFSAGRKVENLVASLKKQTENIKLDLKNMNTLSHKLEESIDDSRYNQTAVTLLLEVCRLVRQSTGEASTQLGRMVSYFEENAELDLLASILAKAEYESIRWPATLGFLTVLLLLCTILVIGVARRSRCALIFFSVFGLFGVIICWLLAGIYLSSSVALGDFCMKPNEFICQHVAMSPHFFDCRKQINSFIIRLNQTKSYVEQTKDSLNRISRMARETHPSIEINHPLENMDKELDDTKRKLSSLSAMLDLSTIHKHYETAIDGMCDGGLLGLSLMMVAGLLTAFLLTVLVYADSHAWIYLRKTRQPEADKSETTPLFPTASTVSPTAPTIASGTSTINRTLLHHQQNHMSSTSTLGVGGSGSGHHKNGSVGLRGLAYNGDSPPPDYNVVVHGTRNSGHHTLGRLPSQQPSFLAGPNNGKYATLSKQCKTLESSDFY